MNVIDVGHPFCAKIIAGGEKYEKWLRHALDAAAVIKTDLPKFGYMLLSVDRDAGDFGFSVRAIDGLRLHIDPFAISDRIAAAIYRLHEAMLGIASNFSVDRLDFPEQPKMLASSDGIWVTNHTLIVQGVTDLIESGLDRALYQKNVSLIAYRLMIGEPSGHEIMEAPKALEALLPTAARLIAKRASRRAE